ncbi:MAG TPA: 1-hydroxy-2-methyl-2-butenyl 4-diphosphate reductase, partial [Actinomycetota bacterium]|nr:1-hydroxy-2-methyl-2-butenyl 4-diphosphate reductase [Actinomycetota bacterium]
MGATAVTPALPGAGLLVLTALGIEARAVRPALGGAEIVEVGMGPARAGRGARQALERASGAHRGPVALAVAGFCGALDPSLAPGSVVVASEVRCLGPEAPPVIACPSAPLIAAGLRAMGIDAAAGAVLSVDHVAGRAERAELRARPEAAGALAVDMESAWMLAAALPEQCPVAVLRVV